MKPVLEQQIVDIADESIDALVKARHARDTVTTLNVGVPEPGLEVAKSITTRGSKQLPRHLLTTENFGDDEGRVLPEMIHGRSSDRSEHSAARCYVRELGAQQLPERDEIGYKTERIDWAQSFVSSICVAAFRVRTISVLTSFNLKRCEKRPPL